MTYHDVIHNHNHINRTFFRVILDYLGTSGAETIGLTHQLCGNVANKVIQTNSKQVRSVSFVSNFYVIVEVPSSKE